MTRSEEIAALLAVLALLSACTADLERTCQHRYVLTAPDSDVIASHARCGVRHE